MSAEGWSGLDPSAERLLTEARARERLPLERRDRLVSWPLAAGFVAVACALGTFGESDRSAPAWLAITLVLAYAAASRIQFEIGSGMAVPTQLVFVPMLFLLPLTAVPMLVAIGYVVGFVPDLLLRRAHPERVVVVVASCWHAVGPAAVLLLAGEPDAALAEPEVLLAALVAQFALDAAGTVARERLAAAAPVRDIARSLAWVFSVDALLAPVGLAAALAASRNPAAALFTLPLAGLLVVFARERRMRLDGSLELSHAYRGTAFLLGDVIEATDAYTAHHSSQVVALTLAVGRELGLDERELRKAELAALLHDIGKIRIPAAIIAKPGPLTPAERALMETHTAEGERLLRRVGGLLAEVGTIVRSCHERPDGAGYPDGLRGDDIPLVARIISCCDAFNAMTTDRPYRPALPFDVAVSELRSNAGSQFDATVVAALLRAIGATTGDPRACLVTRDGKAGRRGRGDRESLSPAA